MANKIFTKTEALRLVFKFIGFLISVIFVASTNILEILMFAVSCYNYRDKTKQDTKKVDKKEKTEVVSTILNYILEILGLAIIIIICIVIEIDEVLNFAISIYRDTNQDTEENKKTVKTETKNRKKQDTKKKHKTKQGENKKQRKNLVKKTTKDEPLLTKDEIYSYMLDRAKYHLVPEEARKEIIEARKFPFPEDNHEYDGKLLTFFKKLQDREEIVVDKNEPMKPVSYITTKEAYSYAFKKRHQCIVPEEERSKILKLRKEKKKNFLVKAAKSCKNFFRF